MFHSQIKLIWVMFGVVFGGVSLFQNNIMWFGDN